MEKPQLILTKERVNASLKPALIDIETHATLKDLSVQTGIPICRLIGKCVAFAMEHLVVVEGEAKAN